VKQFAIIVLCLAALSVNAGLRIPAAEARLKTAGGPVAPTSWNIWSNGVLGDYVKIATTGTYQVTVRAWGSPLDGIWPLMLLQIDGIPEAPVPVAAKTSNDYKFSVKLTAGVHEIAVAFLNDALNKDEDRNLYIESLEIDAPASTLAQPDEWVAESKQREVAMLAASAVRIEQNRKGDGIVSVVDERGRPVEGAEVSVELVQHEFLFGCNIFAFDIFPTDSQDALYKERFAALFNYATLGFYWREYEPRRGKPNYALTDKVVAWCQTHDIRMKGHPLLWDHEASVPKWSLQLPEPALQKQRVTEIIHRYSGRITNWEVVNEPAHLPGLAIDEPYRWARAANPDAHLIVNDFEVLAHGFPPLFELLKKAKADGVPFDGIGIQAHEPKLLRFPLERVAAILDRYAAFGKKLHITEFSPTSAGQPMTGSPTGAKWDEDAQADYAVKFYKVCFAHPAMAAITWWDLCDVGAWLPGGGLLRRDLSPKPAYTALHKLIGEDWHTHAEGATDRAGKFRFRGFYGQYAVTVRRAGQATSGKFLLTRSGKPAVAVIKLSAPTKAVP